MSRSTNIVLGTLILVVGVGVTLASYSAAAHGGSYIVASGAIIVGIARIIRGLVMRDESPARTSEEFEQSLGRTGPSEGPQIVGQACARCGKKIISVNDGEVCSKCQKPLHADCISKHRREKHGGKARPKEGAPPA